MKDTTLFTQLLGLCSKRSKPGLNLFLNLIQDTLAGAMKMKMTKKFVKTYLYKGLGFPIELENVEMVIVNGEYVPKINIRSVANKAIKDLVLQKIKLTGNQVKFVRTYFSLSLREFSKIVNESHTAVRKWEGFGNKPTNMDPNIETTIRVYVYDKICIKNKNDKLKFYDQYHAITEIVSQQENKKSQRLSNSVNAI